MSNLSLRLERSAGKLWSYLTAALGLKLYHDTVIYYFLSSSGLYYNLLYKEKYVKPTLQSKSKLDKKV